MKSRQQRIFAGVAAAVAGTIAAIFLIAPGVSARGNVGAPVRQGATNHTITVSGHGQTDVAPDQATLTLAVETKATDAQTAVADNATKMNAVIAAVEAQGVPASHVQTTNLSLSYDSEHNQYWVTHQVTVRIDNVDKVGAILDAGVRAGANNSWGVDFSLKNPASARAQALQSAVADARSRANSMASALGVSISGVGSASEASYSVNPPPYTVASGARAPVASTPVQVGNLTITADVTVTYTFG